MTRNLARLLRLPAFLAWFVVQMVRANWQVALDILTPGSALTPATVAYQTGSLTPMEVTALSNLITLTPGTLTIDLDDSGGGDYLLYVLGLYAPPDPEEFRAELRELEDRLLHITRAADRPKEREPR
ncbi:Na+/H+ antiporter subunit E [Ornithinimicrobium murale]|uniref:Na+/H+ antiporter subunit E n=1 Tax=Ornithinimicrobium murale TaxID=1050153 RepID=UPI000E0DA105|nr:Na+/H+ antiporter subunit E [Ornithinimicrobium murale]